MFTLDTEDEFVAFVHGYTTGRRDNQAKQKAIDIAIELCKSDRVSERALNILSLED